MHGIKQNYIQYINDIILYCVNAKYNHENNSYQFYKRKLPKKLILNTIKKYI